MKVTQPVLHEFRIHARRSEAVLLMKQKWSAGNDLRSEDKEASSSVEDFSFECSRQDLHKLIHELQAHQLEVELQNEELRRAQAQLEESRARYVDLYDFAPVGYLTLDKNGLILEANLAAASQLGIERAILLKKLFFSYLRNGDEDIFRLHLAQIFKTRERQTCEVKLNPRNSAGVFARLDSIFIEDLSAGGVVRTSLIDISRSKHAEEELTRAHYKLEARVAERTTELSTANVLLRREMEERELAEQALCESREQIIAVADSTKDFICSVDPVNFGVVTWNRAFGEYFLNCRGIELRVGMTPEQLAPPEFFAFFYELFAHVLKVGNFTTEYRVVSGTILLLLSFNIMKRDGEVFGISIFGKDITEHRLMQERITSAAEQWQATFDSIQDQVMVLDQEFRILRANAAAISFFGLPPDIVTASRCHELMHGIDANMAGCPVEMTFRTGQHAEAELFHKGKNAWLLVTADPIMDADGNVSSVVHTVKEVTAHKQMEELLQNRLMEIEKLKKQLEKENIILRDEVKLLSPHAEIVAQSPAMQKILVQVQQVAPTGSTVLITGETGTGKEVIARAVHNLSNRKALPMVIVNCASLPPSLIESELFGREKGAYTGAMSRMVGRFEIADGSTIVLDEIGDLPLEIQAKLLRVLEERRFERLGSTKSISVNVRIVASTNRDLGQMVQTDKFRKDLYYRLKVFPITIPPLRERPEDIPPLTWSFIHYFEKRMGKHIQSIPQRCMETLVSYSWPGNARELRNFIEHAMIVNPGTSLEMFPPAHPPQEIFDEERELETIERRHILRVLDETGWRISSRGGAAEMLGLKPTTLEAKMKKLGIRRP
ncbi:MAG: sigma 54-interacting transcriptional regulator [Syntrophobacteraceae bacterium]|nr:sigma 54-interacting transcriptional regulator [Syntrophobacteraceae bacterium]